MRSFLSGESAAYMPFGATKAPEAAVIIARKSLRDDFIVTPLTIFFLSIKNLLHHILL
jgi:hypothetical protein